MLQDRHGALVVLAAQQHLAEEREADAIRAVDLHDAQQLGLRFLPLVHRGEGPREHHPAFEAVGRGIEPEVRDLDRILGTSERKIGLAEIDERRRSRVPPNKIDQLLDFLSRGPAIRINHQARRG